MQQRETVAIIGVGLIGGSVGLALRRRGLARRVIGIGRREGPLQEALNLGAITEATTDLAAGVSQAELIIVCTPVASIVEHVRAAAQRAPRGALVTDTGSTKGEIVAALDRGLPAGATFVGSHPMAGREKKGAEFAKENLFENHLAIVTPTAQTPLAAVEAIKEFWQSLGARTISMAPHEHDAAVAAVSHLPHLAASALAAATPENLLPLAASGWRSCTRVASGDVELWRQIFTENRLHVLQSLVEFEKTLSSFREALSRGDDAELIRLLEQGKRRRDAVGN
jgi:prephenate dehydrogenase